MSAVKAPGRGTPSGGDGPVGGEAAPTRLLTEAQLHQRDAILGHYRRRTDRRLRGLGAHFALLRYARSR